ncbi:type VII secretion-associated protein [Haloechinothrix halophila]|uniref:Chaperone protein HscA n=1 Tax=Haloechinothrix halophila YIM 93223 TaxID=592678 RepID=W9DN81_9PSEU|nr:type VII secretion-associated protein [Haloechinothrix halophila]ETA66363.1 Chaperone protein HscA [Haloechinothrix halophila YIM 93223]
MSGARTLRVAVDFGTSSTCVAVSPRGEDPQVVVIDGQPLLRSAVYAAPDGTLFVGQEAERQAAVDPSRYEPHPKRRVDEGELLLGTQVLSVREAFRAVLSRAVSEARRFAGGAEVGLLVLTHPADWGVVRTRTLRQAAAGLAQEVTLLPEPVAAAVFHTSTFSRHDGGGGNGSGTPTALAVLDLGGGTVDVSVVRGDGDETAGGFRVLATKGDPGFGGADVDQALLEFIGSRIAEEKKDAWRALMEGRELADRRRRRVLRQDVRGAKETLSRHAYTDVPMPQPFADAHVTRQDLERLIAEPLGRAVALTSAAINEAGLRPDQLGGIFLVGGSSRIPMVGRLVHEQLGVVPTTLDQPETVVARGAMLSVLAGQRSGRTAHAAQSARPARTGPPAGAAPGPATQGAGIPGAAASGPPSGPIPAPGAAPGTGTPGAPPTASPAHGGTSWQHYPHHQRHGYHRSGLAGGGPHQAQPGQPQQTAKKRRVLPWVLGGSLVVVVALVAAVALWPTSSGQERLPDAMVAQFSYQFDHPPDWEQTDLIRDENRVVVRPSSAPDGTDLISVQQFSLSYDFDEDRERFLSELRTGLDETGRDYVRFNPDFVFVGRSVIHYTEKADDSTVEWFVVGADQIQVSVGCRWTSDAKDAVESACEEVVRTLRITEPSTSSESRG